MKKLILSFFLTTLFVVGYGQSTYEIGDIINDFSLKNVDGTMVSMEDYSEEEGIILIVSCNTCPWVVKNEDRMIELHNTYAAQGFPVIAVNPNDANRSPGDSYNAMKARAERKDFPFKYVYDVSQELASKLGASRTPEVFLMENTDQGWKLRYHGAIDDSPGDAEAVEEAFVEIAIKAIKEGKRIEKEFTRSVGCTIKWKTS